jgi:hypothetical protein
MIDTGDFSPISSWARLTPGEFFLIGSRMRSILGILESVEAHLLSLGLELLQLP